MWFSWSLSSPFSFFLSVVIFMQVFSGHRQCFYTATGCIYRWLFQVSFFLQPSPPLLLSGCSVSLWLSPILGLYPVLGSDYPLSTFTALLLVQKPFVSKDFLNSPRSCLDFFNSTVLRSNWNAEVPLASPWYTCPLSGIKGFSPL